VNMTERLKEFLVKLPDWALTLIGFVVVGLVLAMVGVNVVVTYVTKPALARVKKILPDEWEAVVLAALRKLVSIWEEV